MCGITGWWSKNSKINRELFNSMRDTLTHRGPDGYDSYFSSDEKLALGHRILAFNNFSKSDTQVTCSENKNVYSVFNGKIYNYKKLRILLEEKSHIFKSNSDDELIIHAYQEWGMKFLEKIDGMFAFAIFDNKLQKLFLVKDRFGVKPLYYFCDKENLIFASEIKAIIKNPEIKREINKKSISEYFIYRYIPSPNTIFQDIFKIPPAHYIEIDKNFNISHKKYFELKIDIKKQRKSKLIKEIEELIRNSIKEQIDSDTDIASFLSGGFDSSILVKYFSEIKKEINTFSIGFENWEKSEHLFAEKVSKIYKTNHFSKLLNQESLNILDELMYYYDEPIADISIIPTYFACKLASQHNKIILSGEGADEFFAGYGWHKEYLWEISKAELTKAKKWNWDLPINNFDIDSYAKAMAMGEFDEKELKFLLTEKYHQYTPTDTKEFYRKYFNENIDKPKRFQAIDIKAFMGELLLTKMDRASMANSLEVRMPFLNKEICEKMLSLDTEKYFDKKKRKIILYKLLQKDLPKKILNRKKQGFTGPDEFYMNFEFYEKNLNNSKLVEAEIINQSAINHYIKQKDHWRLWKILVLEKWFKKWIA